ncbi:hypothetical protein LJC61_06735 [Ruminococcaceae bacterium OttesenSCG-928-A16]|nr:hypothetical protein [Ruminococcaceae bacterium OttesenSCG-928-A16]
MTPNEYTTTAIQEPDFTPRPWRWLLFAGTMLCMGVIMLGMVLTSPARKRKQADE